jgi:hypothetical protein
LEQCHFHLVFTLPHELNPLILVTMRISADTHCPLGSSPPRGATVIAKGRPDTPSSSSPLPWAPSRFERRRIRF